VVVETTVPLVDVADVSETVVVVGVTSVELVSVGVTTAVPVTASDGSVDTAVSGAVVATAVVASFAVAFSSTASRLQATTASSRISSARKRLNIANPLPAADSRQKPGRTAGTVIALALIAIAAARMAATFTVFSATADEPMHLSCGLLILTQHHYGYQLENPPLPRVVFAYAAWRAGMKFDPNASLEDQLRSVYYANGQYIRNLVIARSGNLLFFLIGAIATWLLGRRMLGETGGVLTTLLYTMQPVVLGYSTFVSHDSAAVAGVAVSLLAYSRWLDRPTIQRAAVFGAAYGFAIACKFSDIAYVPAACAAMYVVRLIHDRETRRAWKSALLAVPVAAAAAAIVITASYAGAIGYFIEGIKSLIILNDHGHLGYLMGEMRPTGWWYYFPIAFVLKTTIASMLLVLLGVVTWRDRAFGEALAAALAILGVAMTGNLDLGIRYVLPMYIPLSVAAAAVALALLRNSRMWVRAVAMALLVAHAGVSLLAGHDTMAYFNVFAGRDPSRILTDSNIEWGQDVLRLAKVVKERKIDRLAISVHGIHDFDKLGFPPTYHADMFTPTNGWVAVGDHSYRYGLASGGGWWWLQRQPYERVGRSIRLYHLP